MSLNILRRNYCIDNLKTVQDKVYFKIFPKNINELKWIITSLIYRKNTFGLC